MNSVASQGDRSPVIACLPGDGIGPEVMAQARRVVEALLPEAQPQTWEIGASAIASVGQALPAETLAACARADAVLLGAIGSSDYSTTAHRAEDALFALRRELDVFANLRPTRGDQLDIVIVRELVGGLYFGEKGRRADGSAYDVCEYTPAQVERVARVAFELARKRSGRLTSVDKANVLETSRMWREVVTALAEDYRDVELEHMLVDTAALQLVTRPGRLDVLVTENTFGDILSDVAAGLAGGLGQAASASLALRGPGLFEPVHGTAPDIAGTGQANPAAMILSVAMMLEHGLGLGSEAARVHGAVAHALEHCPTRDLGGEASTSEFGDCVLGALGASC